MALQPKSTSVNRMYTLTVYITRPFLIKEKTLFQIPHDPRKSKVHIIIWLALIQCPFYYAKYSRNFGLHRTAGCVVFAGPVRLISPGGLVDTIRHNSPVRLGDTIRHDSPVRLGDTIRHNSPIRLGDTIRHDSPVRLVWPNTRGSLQALFAGRVYLCSIASNDISICKSNSV